MLIIERTQTGPTPATNRPPASLWFCGLDLGQASDFTALAILERPPVTWDNQHPVYLVRHLMRFELGTSYTAIASEVYRILTMPPLKGDWLALAIDATGVGRAVCDMMRPFFPGAFAVTITGGRVETPTDGGANVPKLSLVSTLQVLLQNRRLRIAQSLPEAATLARELQAFRVRVNVGTGNESFEAWRERDHDDLVLAVAMAAWLGEGHAEAERDPEQEETAFVRYTT